MIDQSGFRLKIALSQVFVSPEFDSILELLDRRLYYLPWQHKLADIQRTITLRGKDRLRNPCRSNSKSVVLSHFTRLSLHHKWYVFSLVSQSRGLTVGAAHRVKVHLYQEDLQEVKKTRFVTHLFHPINLCERFADYITLFNCIETREGMLKVARHEGTARIVSLTHSSWILPLSSFTTLARTIMRVIRRNGNRLYLLESARRRSVDLILLRNVSSSLPSLTLIHADR